MLSTPDGPRNRIFLSEGLAARVVLQHVPAPGKLHWHDCYELSFVLSGHGINLVNGIACPLEAGTLFLLGPADVHEIAPAAGTALQLTTLNFSPALLDGDLATLAALRSLRGGLAVCRLEEAAQRSALGNAFALLAGKLQAAAAGCGLAVLEHVQCALAYLGTAGAAASAGDAAVEQALAYLHCHFRKPVRLRDAAARAGLPCTQFGTRFAAATGQPFALYLRALRIDFADALLGCSALPLGEIAAAAGFRSRRHFERAYRAARGRPPA